MYMRSIDSVGTRKTKPKGKLLTVRIPEDMLAEFGIVAQVRDVSMSEIVFNFVRQTINEQKDLTPNAFISHSSSDKQQAVKIARRVVKSEPIIEQKNWLMSDPQGKNAGTKRLPKKIRLDIEDAKAAIEELEQKERSQRS